MSRRAAVGAATLLALCAAAVGAAAFWGPRFRFRSASASQPPGEPPFVPEDAPGAPQALEWLSAHLRGLRGRRPRWPSAVALPHCRAPVRRAGSTRSAQKRYLVLATVGDTWQPGTNGSRWLDDPAQADFDLVVIYFGESSNYSCPECRHVFADHGPKWQMVHRAVLSPEWEALVTAGDYRYIWLPDDDLMVGACNITRFFRLMEQHNLPIAQMSLCRVEGSAVLWPHLYERQGNALRYVAFVEIMATGIRLDLFQAVIRVTMDKSWTGWGLDSLWPYLLRFPRDGLAVVDAVCMAHTRSAGAGHSGQSNYAAAACSPYANPWDEGWSVVRRWHINDDVMRELQVPTDIGGRGTLEWHTASLANGSAGVRARGPAAARAATQLLAEAEPSALRPVALPVLALILVAASLAMESTLQRLRQAQAARAPAGAAGEVALASRDEEGV